MPSQGRRGPGKPGILGSPCDPELKVGGFQRKGADLSKPQGTKKVGEDVPPHPLPSLKAQPGLSQLLPAGPSHTPSPSGLCRLAPPRLSTFAVPCMCLLGPWGPQKGCESAARTKSGPVHFDQCSSQFLVCLSDHWQGFPTPALLLFWAGQS